jgi:hypothetical protein
MSFPSFTHTAESERRFRIPVPVRVIEASQQRAGRVIQFLDVCFASILKLYFITEEDIENSSHFWMQ